MSEITLFGGQLVSDESRIARVINLSDNHTDRMRVVFENGYELSIIRPAMSNWEIGRGFSGAYGDATTYEIAVFGPDGKFTREFFDEDAYDDVLGWQTAEEVISYANKISSK